MKRIAAAVIVLVALSSALDAYVLMNDRWADGSIVMQLQLGSSAPLIDGRSGWNASAEDALAAWNDHLGRVKFRVVRDSTAPAGDNNGFNNVFFSSAIYTQSFGTTTLAVTTNWYRVSTHQRTEADVIFNSAFSWNSYAGPLRRTASGGTLADLHRVALHEFGHVLGLNHPDQAGQYGASIMNSSISNIDVLQADDLSGVAALYGAPGVGDDGSRPALAAPGAPGGLTTAASGAAVSMSWRAPSSGGPPAAYVIEAGSGPVEPGELLDRHWGDVTLDERHRRRLVLRADEGRQRGGNERAVERIAARAVKAAAALLKWSADRRTPTFPGDI